MRKQSFFMQFFTESVGNRKGHGLMRTPKIIGKRPETELDPFCLLKKGRRRQEMYKINGPKFIYPKLF